MCFQRDHYDNQSNLIGHDRKVNILPVISYPAGLTKIPKEDTLCTTPLSHLDEATLEIAPTSARFSNDIERTSFFPSVENSSICTLITVPALFSKMVKKKIC